MLLAVDLGNSNITFGLFSAKKLLKKIILPIHSTCNKRKFIQEIKKVYSRFDIDTIIICSVVPKIEKVLITILKEAFKVKPLVLGKSIKVPIRNLYKKSEQVGQDRLINAYVGYAFYKTPLIIIDFGTAVTFDVVSKKGAYLGGIIAPGMEMSLNTLSEKAALLPKIKLKRPSTVLGKTTSDSMASGVFYGYAAMCDGLVARLEKKFGYKFNVVITGGNAHLIKPLTVSIKKLDEDLILKGINLVHRSSGKNKKC